ncbi:MAG: glycosyltransferase [Bacteroidales bacterium]
MIWLLIIPFVFYLTIFIISGNFLRTLKPPARKEALRNVPVSVIVACRNEETNLPYLLSDLARQDYPDELVEVIVVDDHSTDNTINTISEFRGIRNLRILKNRGHGKKAAIRTGVESSSSELIIVTDADCRTGASWISSLASLFASEKPAMIIGPVKLDEKKSLLNIFQHIEWLGLQGITAATAVAGNPVMCNGANIAFTKETFLLNASLLHYNILSGDDIFLLHAVKASGRKIIMLTDPDAMVTTSPVVSVSELLKQRARWISKAHAYTDILALILSSVVFLTVTDLGFLLAGSIINIQFFPVFVAGFVLKSIADIILTGITAGLYKQKSFILWIIPLQIIYPFYLACIIFCLLPGLHDWKRN